MFVICQAHINHRHIAAPAQLQQMQVDQSQYMHSKVDLDSQLTKSQNSTIANNRLKQVGNSHIVQPIMGNDPRVNSIVSQQNVEHRQQHRSQSMLGMPNYTQNSTPSSNSQLRTNLITVPIQDTTINSHELQHSQQSHHYYAPPQVNYAGYSVPPPPPPPVSQSQQYYSQTQRPTQVAYMPVAQQQYVTTAPSTIRQTSGYLPDQYTSHQNQQQTQWTQQQFYR